MKVSLHVLKPGSCCTVQDLGRQGVASRGFSSGGAMDQYAARAANALVDNSADAALIEVTLGGFQFEVDGPVDMAVCGAEAPLQINQRYVESWRTHALEAGDIVTLGFAQRGARLYVALAGGAVVAPRLGSSSTVLRESIGGYHGRALRAGDAVELAPRELSMQPRRFSVTHRHRFGGVVNLLASAGPQWQQLSREGRRRLVGDVFQVSQQCDRMGYRLQSDEPLQSLPGMLSEGVGLGAVQLPNNGHPIVLMRDHQTMGGYPKPLVLLPEGVDALGQCRPGDAVKFTLLSNGEARRRVNTYQQRLQRMPWEYVS